MDHYLDDRVPWSERRSVRPEQEPGAQQRTVSRVLMKLGDWWMPSYHLHENKINEICPSIWSINSIVVYTPEGTAMLVVQFTAFADAFWFRLAALCNKCLLKYQSLYNIKHNIRYSGRACYMQTWQAVMELHCIN